MRLRATAVLLTTLLAGCGGDDARDPELRAPQAAGSGAAPATAENRPPAIESVRLEPSEPARGQELRAVVTARDPDGDSVRLGYRWFVDGAERSWGEASLALRDVRKGARVGVRVTASDGRLESEPVRTEVTVIDRAPALAGVEIEPRGSVTPGTPLRALAAATDPDGDAVEIEYRWLVNGEPTEVRGTVFPTGDLRQDDEVRLEVVASDGTNRTSPQRSEPVRIGSAHPEIVSRPPDSSDDGVFRYTVVAEDPDDDRRLRYRLGRAPQGMVIDKVLGEITWRPAEGQEGIHAVEVVVADSTGLETKQSFEVTVRGEAPDPPASAE